MNKVVEILMKRDGISEGDAESLRQEAAELLEAGEYDAIQTVLGLEDDFIFDVLGW